MCIASLAGVAGAAAAKEPGGPKPLRPGYVEHEAIRLIALDVNVRDAHGGPRHGLKAKDFTLRLDGRLWPIYSVDDLCEGTGGSGAGGAEPAPPAGNAQEPERSVALRFVLYFDFSELRDDGRLRAHRAAMQWVREVRRPGDETMVVAHSTRSGVRILQRWTRSGDLIEKAVETAFSDRSLFDGFPERLVQRVGECQDCIKDCLVAKSTVSTHGGHGLPPKSEKEDCADQCGICYNNARDETRHGRDALKHLALFLSWLEETDGRKAVLLFEQNAMVYPARLYPLHDPDLIVGTLLPQAKQVGAEATRARAALYPMHAGNNQYYVSIFDNLPKDRYAVEMTSNLADFSGGDYSRGPSDTHRFIEQAGRQVSCLYRVAFRPPQGSRGRIYQATIRAAGRRVPWSYQVEFVSDAEQVMRRARALLAGMSDGTVEVTAALVPIEAGKRRWKLAAEVAVQARSLQILLVGEDSSARLDVGAILVRESDGGTREMLTGSVIRGQAGTAGGTLLYETTFEDLQPGKWTLRAFVLNRSVDQAGRAEVSIDLPKPGAEGFVGPLAAVPARKVYRSELTLRDGKEHGESGKVVAPRESFAPLGDAPVLRGETLRMSSWACSGPDTPPSRSLVTFIERDGQPVFRVPEGESDGAVPCARITSVVRTIELVPGQYTYRVAWKAPGDGALSDAAPPVAFSVISGQAPPLTTRR